MPRWFTVVVVLACSFFVVACGDDDDDSSEDAGAATATFSFDGKEMTGPTELEAGIVRVEFTNEGEEDAGVTLIKIADGHTAEEAGKAGEAWGDGGKPLPEWVTFEGGSTSVLPGDSFSSEQQLDAGTYSAIDINSNKFVEVEVSGDGTGELPETDARIEAIDYSFESEGLKAGTQAVLFENTGKESHFALIAPIKPGKTIEDVKKSLESEEGPPPIIEDETVSTGLLDGGRSQVVSLKPKKGPDALVCFVADRAGGPPHAFKGMVTEATVE